MEKELTRLTEEDFDEIYNIMEYSFPADERRGYEGQKALFCDKSYRVYALKNQIGDLIAFITVYEFEKFTFAEHFAVAKEYRNCGIGSEVLSLLKNRVKSPICLEVELPETDMAKRRIEFYKRNGFYYNEYDYIQPAYSKDKSPVPLKIMTTEREITEAEFESMRDVLYSRVYFVEK